MSDEKKSWLKSLAFNPQRHEVDGFGTTVVKDEPVNTPVPSEQDSGKRYLPIGAPGLGLLYRPSPMDASARSSSDESRQSLSGRLSLDSSERGSLASRHSMDGNAPSFGRASLDGAQMKKARSYGKMDLEHTYTMWSSA